MTSQLFDKKILKLVLLFSTFIFIGCSPTNLAPTPVVPTATPINSVTSTPMPSVIVATPTLSPSTNNNVTSINGVIGANASPPPTNK